MDHLKPSDVSRSIKVPVPTDLSSRSFRRVASELGYIEHRALLEGIQEQYSTKKAMIIASKLLALKRLEEKLMLGTPMPQPKPEKRRRLE
jgi:hypothetical protein